MPVAAVWANTSEASLVPVWVAVATFVAELYVNDERRHDAAFQRLHRGPPAVALGTAGEDAERKRAFGVPGRDRITDMVRVSRCGLGRRCGSMPVTEESSARASHEISERTHPQCEARAK